MSRPKLMVYVNRPAAPLCKRVRDFLDHRGYEYETVDVVTDEDRTALRERTGHESCPLVMVGNTVIGKLPETVEADRSGRLRELLDEPAT
jgi:glutaredoxin